MFQRCGQAALNLNLCYCFVMIFINKNKYLSFQTIEKLPDKVLLNIFTYLSHREICRMAMVSKRWRLVAYDTKLWTHVSLRPEISGLHVG